MQGLRTTRIIAANRSSCKICNSVNFFAGFFRIVKNSGKLIFCIAFVAVLLGALQIDAYAGEQQPYDELYSLLEIDDVEDITKEEIKKYAEIDFDISDEKAMWQINGYDIIKNIIINSFSVDGSAFNILSVVLVIAVLYMLTLKSEKGEAILGVSYDTVTSAVCLVVLLAPVSFLLFDVCSAIESCCVFMSAFIPVYSVVIFATGKSATSGSYASLMFVFTQIFTIPADKVFAPLGGVMLTSAAGSSFGTISKRYFDVLKKFMVVVLSASMGIFITVLNMQTAISSSSDTVGMKTVKTALGALVPIVGTAISDTVSVITAGAGTLKCSVGIYAVVSIVVLVLPPLIKLLLWRVTVALCSSIVELAGAQSAKTAVKSIGEVITLMISVLLCTSVAYLLSVILTLSAGG